jgi:hypothetical protein
MGDYAHFTEMLYFMFRQINSKVLLALPVKNQPFTVRGLTDKYRANAIFRPRAIANDQLDNAAFQQLSGFSS